MFKHDLEVFVEFVRGGEIKARDDESDGLGDVLGGREWGLKGRGGGVRREVGVDGPEGGELVGTVGGGEGGGRGGAGDGGGGGAAAAEAGVGVAAGGGSELPWIGGGWGGDWRRLSVLVWEDPPGEGSESGQKCNLGENWVPRLNIFAKNKHNVCEAVDDVWENGSPENDLQGAKAADNKEGAVRDINIV
ncbi:hypothetical protein RJ639_022295 [Escallonia herrerae]|uniref:Uncharacterized protein n=1 Tax=Escallonia herrerae TaxID=1293975 RepID=A0AA89AHB3_9ASTE|nr:hypothetical protein RJ639_022295 [Escallonia herrerae]